MCTSTLGTLVSKFKAFDGFKRFYRWDDVSG
jgi:hypothetical protein